MFQCLPGKNRAGLGKKAMLYVPLEWQSKGVVILMAAELTSHAFFTPASRARPFG